MCRPTGRYAAFATNPFTDPSTDLRVPEPYARGSYLDNIVVYATLVT